MRSLFEVLRKEHGSQVASRAADDLYFPAAHCTHLSFFISCSKPLPHVHAVDIFVGTNVLRHLHSKAPNVDVSVVIGSQNPSHLLDFWFVELPYEPAGQRYFFPSTQYDPRGHLAWFECRFCECTRFTTSAVWTALLRSDKSIRARLTYILVVRSTFS